MAGARRAIHRGEGEGAFGSLATRGTTAATSVHLTLRTEPAPACGEEPSVAIPATDADVIMSSLADPAAFGEIFDRHARTLATYLIRRVGVDDGELLLSELFRIAFEVRHRYQHDRPDARPWLYGIAANLIMKHRRSSARGARAIERLASQAAVPDDLEGAVAESMATRERWIRVEAAIAGLPARDREVLFLYAWEELSYADIAVALHIPLGTVRSRLNRVRTSLRELESPTGEVPDSPTLGAGGGRPT